MFAKSLCFSVLLTLVAFRAADAQSATPLVVQAMPASTPTAVVAAPPAQSQSSQAATKALEEIKAANEAILAKQAATLQQLEEMEKAADQIKIYTKRG